ncbi:septum formation initiator family protein [Deinococcus lacus]|uniref:Septum formation initiator family protein n=1 Tax=Deinococcus lacus TaxID=392561 RepID=A0ABW1YB86_9DEIO
METSPPPRLGVLAWLRRAWRELARLPVALMTACVLLALGTGQTVLHLGQSVYRTATWSRETAEVEGSNAALRHDIQVLLDAKAALDTPEYLSQLARCQGYIGPGEKVYVAANEVGHLAGANCDVRPVP